MNLPLRVASLVATLLLFGTLGCSKKDNPAVSPAPAASYQLDGTKVNCLATARLSTDNGTGQSYDLLDIRLTTTPQPASGPEVLHLAFAKTTGQPISTYVLTDLDLINATFPSGLPHERYTTTLTAPSATSFSGTFSGEFITYSNGKTYVVSEGTFTNINL